MPGGTPGKGRTVPGDRREFSAAQASERNVRRSKRRARASVDLNYVAQKPRAFAQFKYLIS